MDPKLLEILVCPVCKGPLLWKKDAGELVCKADRLAFPVKDDIPVMLEDEARALRRRRGSLSAGAPRLQGDHSRRACARRACPGRCSPTSPASRSWRGRPKRAAASGADEVIVATDHQDIADAVAALGWRVCTTSVEHPTGTDRLAEAVALLRPRADDEIVVNVQGDEPLIDPQAGPQGGGRAGAAAQGLDRHGGAPDRLGRARSSIPTW